MSNMYDFIQKTFNPMAGECPHQCAYCYVKDLKRRNQLLNKKYSGAPRLVEKELKPLGKGKFVFVCSCFDLFADGIDKAWIAKIILHCIKYPDNIYLFQTKNPLRFYEFNFNPLKHILGITLETNRTYSNMTKAPVPGSRAYVFAELNHPCKMVTIEPILDFDLRAMIHLIKLIQPAWVNIGADSKNNGLPEPPWEKVQDLIEELKKITDVKIKKNLELLRDKSK